MAIGRVFSRFDRFYAALHTFVTSWGGFPPRIAGCGLKSQIYKQANPAIAKFTCLARRACSGKFVEAAFGLLPINGVKDLS